MSARDPILPKRSPVKPTPIPTARTVSSRAASQKPAVIDMASDDKARTTGTNRGANATAPLGQAPEDQWDGMSLADILMAQYGAMNQTPSGSGGGGGRGGGGSAAAANPDPLGWSSIAMQQNTNDSYAKMLAALQQQGASVLGGFDQRIAGAGQERDASAARATQLIADQQVASNGARTQVQGAYASGDQQLQNIMAQYSQMIQARQPGANATLQAFGAAPGATADVSGVQDSLTAQRAMQSRMGTADDALFANRANVYNGLNTDVSNAREAGFTSLTNSLAQQRQQAAAEQAQAAAQLQMQQQQQILQLQQAEQARAAQYA